MAGFSVDRHFCIYDDVSGTPNGTLSGEVWLDIDPRSGSYSFGEFELRGQSIETIGWRFTQVFPYVEGSTERSRYQRKISIQDENTMSRGTAVALAGKYTALGIIYRFYDGENIFRVWFSMNPPGFVFSKAIVPWHEGRMLTNPPNDAYLFYSYQIVLDVLEVVSSPEGLT